MTNEILFVVIPVVAVIGYFAVRWLLDRAEVKRIHDSLDQKCGINGSFARFKYKQTTPKGVSLRGTVKLPATALEDIDTGIENQLVRYAVRYPNWTEGLDHRDYRVLIIDPMATNVETDPGSPALLVMGVQTAGTCIGVFHQDAAKRPYIVLPHQAETNWSHRMYLMLSAWHESEHYKENVNDYNVFLEYQGANDVHPHVP